jgi:Uma2 family endonuclease
MGMPNAATHHWTREDLERLPDDGNRYEVLDGELFVTPLPVPLHQWLAVRLSSALSAYVSHHRIGIVLGPAAVVWSRNELQPDVAVLPMSVADLRSQRWEDLPLPMLVVEVLSPSTRSRDRGRKRTAYVSLGIAEYWMLDPDTHQVTVVAADGSESQCAEQLVWTPVPDIEPFVLPLDALFG